jgi:hypothetical protein
MLPEDQEAEAIGAARTIRADVRLRRVTEGVPPDAAYTYWEVVGIDDPEATMGVMLPPQPVYVSLYDWTRADD